MNGCFYLLPTNWFMERKRILEIHTNDIGWRYDITAGGVVDNWENRGGVVDNWENRGGVCYIYTNLKGCVHFFYKLKWIVITDEFIYTLSVFRCLNNNFLFKIL